MGTSVRPPPVASHVSGPSAARRLITAGAAGVVAAVVLGVLGPWQLIPIAFWIASALVYVAWTWLTIWPYDATQTARHARQEDPSRAWTGIVLLSASGVSLLALGIVLVRAGQSHGLEKGLLVGSCILSVVLAWAVVHTVYSLRYADLYYDEEPGGIDFNEDDPPDYGDFAYLAWTIGMTFQVSDTDLKTKRVRRTALQHGLLSYAFGALIIATTVNLIAGLGK
jgi:uncharacterized membrane protein